MKPTNKKGQAALEFLSTYGFAFLIILVMIGALAYFGVLNPSNFLPDRCNVGPAWGCEEYNIVYVAGPPETLTASMVFVNRAGTAITPPVIETSLNGVVTAAPCTLSTLAANIPQGGRFTATCPVSSTLYAEGDRLRVDFVATFTGVGMTLPQSVAGDVSARMQG